MKKSVIVYRLLVTALFIMSCIVFHQKPVTGLCMGLVQKNIQERKAESDKTFPEDSFVVRVLLRFSEIIQVPERVFPFGENYFHCGKNQR
ncbi:MAG: hypothetical protein KF746_26450 [Chitinophagaceae bacterium]|nr:hypothetical protein [Chitinophagaceae bacterium]